jgi:hypothetical protein
MKISKEEINGSVTFTDTPTSAMSRVNVAMPPGRSDICTCILSVKQKVTASKEYIQETEHLQ